MKSFRLLWPVCLFVLLSGCAALEQQWRQTYCSREGGYRLGMEDASNKFPMRPQVAYNCDAVVQSAMSEGYREGYASVSQTAQAAPPATASAQTAPPPEATMSVSPPPAASSSTAAPADNIRCCLNGAYYSCPDVAAVDRCGGAFSRCVMGCMNSMDMKCEDRCLKSSPPDPSSCQRDSSQDSACR